jgi:PTS system nitrogen regulatory IIA component
MDLTDLLSLDAIIPALKAVSKKQVIQGIAERAAKVAGLPERTVFDTILQRERLGSTGVGRGVAIPHCRMDNCERLVGIFARLERPVDFEAIDDMPVDIVFALIAPEGAGADHLKALAKVARVLRDPAIVAKLRASRDQAALYALLIQGPASNAA